jgi:E3 ubiquitin-protein ligase RAD18
MDGAFDIPDSTDWLNTSLKDFSTLENALHCEICKEFYDTPMITSCSHTFCSKCIRTALSTDGRCPSCRAQDQASKLRNNYALQEIVARFLVARPTALEVARREKESEEAESGTRKRGGKRKRTVLDSDDIAQSREDTRTTRSKSRRIAASQTSEPETIEVMDSEGDSDFTPEREPNDGLVECPLGCGKRMKIEAVDPHLDRCEEEQKQASRSKSRTPVNMFGSSRPPSTQNSRPQERISELNYSLLNDTKLRNKLKELGIPNWGPKQLMIKRHTEWVNLWNANCDSKHPRSERDLLRELDQWERTQGGRAPNPSGLASTVMRKDFDGTAWTNRNRDDFSRLIAEAKREKHNPAIEPERSKSVEVMGGEEAPTVGFDGEANRSSPQPPRPPAETLDPERPYENNPEAVSLIREKVEAANAGQHIEPVMNAGFQPHSLDGTTHEAQSDDPNPLPSTDNPALLEKSHFGLLNDTNLDIRTHQDPRCDLQSSPIKRVPMFTVPQQPFSGLDGAGGGTLEH